MDDMTAASTQRRFMFGLPVDGKRAESKTVLISNGLITPMLAVINIRTVTEIT